MEFLDISWMHCLDFLHVFLWFFVCMTPLLECVLVSERWWVVNAGITTELSLNHGSHFSPPFWLVFSFFCFLPALFSSIPLENWCLFTVLLICRWWTVGNGWRPLLEAGWLEGSRWRLSFTKEIPTGVWEWDGHNVSFGSKSKEKIKELKITL